jgi:hypothetical protein
MWKTKVPQLVWLAGGRGAGTSERKDHKTHAANATGRAALGPGAGPGRCNTPQRNRRMNIWYIPSPVRVVGVNIGPAVYMVHPTTRPRRRYIGPAVVVRIAAVLEQDRRVRLVPTYRTCRTFGFRTVASLATIALQNLSVNSTQWRDFF